MEVLMARGDAAGVVEGREPTGEGVLERKGEEKD